MQSGSCSILTLHLFACSLRQAGSCSQCVEIESRRLQQLPHMQQVRALWPPPRSLQQARPCRARQMERNQGPKRTQRSVPLSSPRMPGHPRPTATRGPASSDLLCLKLQGCMVRRFRGLCLRASSPRICSGALPGLLALLRGRTPQPQPPQPRPPRASRAPSAFVDLDSSSSNASSTEVHGAAAGSAQHDAQSAQGSQAAEAQHANSQASPPNGRSLAAHRRAPPPTGPIFRPTPPAPKYHRRQPAAGTSIAAKAAAAAAEGAAPGPDASSAATPATRACADRAGQPDAAYASGPLACLIF